MQSIGALCAVALTALAASTSGVRADAPQVVRIGATSNDTAAEVYYADELGMFKKRGLQVEIQNQRSGAAEAAAVAGGALDIGEQNVVSMSHAHERGLPFKYVAPAGEYHANASTTNLVASKSSTIKTGKDLAGKTVAVSALGDLSQIGAAAWIDKHGGNSSAVHFIEMPAAEIGAAVGRGTIDAGVIPEPALTVAEDAGQVKVVAQPYDAIADHFMINGWFATDDWIKKNPAAARNFVDAVLEAGKWANAHHAESAKILERHSKVEAAVLAHMRRVTYGEKFDTKALQNVVDSAVQYKGLAKGFNAAELIDANL